jgi:protein arginine kinase
MISLHTLRQQLPQWSSCEAPEGAIALFSHCSAGRNLADFPYPQRCSEDEKSAVEAHVIHALDSLASFTDGHYYSLTDLTSQEIRFLAERRLITYEMMTATGPRGVYIDADQSLSIMVNGLDHICIRVLLAGSQLPQAWKRLNSIDNALHEELGFSFHNRLGYLTSVLGNVGTGLKAGIVVHLPALTSLGQVSRWETHAAEQHVRLLGVTIGSPEDPHKPVEEVPAGQSDLIVHSDIHQSLYSDMNGALSGSISEAQGDLYLLVNQSTLGVSEEELLFQVRQTVSEVIDAEKKCREELLSDKKSGIEDRVGRARGVAGGARVLGFAEAVNMLSSLRLGVATGVLPSLEMEDVNQLLTSSQGGHLELDSEYPCDELILNKKRASLFRANFG